MAYEMLSLGVVAKGSSGCTNGLEHSGGGGCCEERFWRNLVLAQLEGASSRRHRNEARVHEALALLSPESIDNFRYREEARLGQSLVVQSGLAERAATAKANFNILYPASRWGIFLDGVESNCAPGGRYPRWAPTAQQLSPAYSGLYQRVVAAMNLTGADLRAGDPGSDLINTVAGSADYERVSDGPKVDDVLRVSNGTVVPTPWTSAFLDRFNPRLGAQPRRMVATTAPRASEVVGRRAAAAPAAEFPWLVVGAAVLVAGGAAVYYVKTR